MEIQKIPNQVIKQPLQYLRLNNVDGIALHHMATNVGIKEIECIHINQGWRAIGYNFWVGFDGTVYEGRGFKLGAGVENENGHIISIGFQGDYHSREVEMPDVQFNAGVDLIKYVMSKVPTAKTIGGHKDFGPSVCPGRFFPLDEMKTLKKRGENKVVYYNTVNQCPGWSQPYVKKAVDEGFIKGDGNGNLQLTDDRIWTLVVALRINGIME